MKSLDKYFKYAYGVFAMASYSTAHVAKIVGVDKSTLLRWLYSGRLAEPKRIQQPGIESRVWSEKDLQRVKKFKEQNYRQGRARKKAT